MEMMTSRTEVRITCRMNYTRMLLVGLYFIVFFGETNQQTVGKPNESKNQNNILTNDAKSENASTSAPFDKSSDLSTTDATDIKSVSFILPSSQLSAELVLSTQLGGEENETERVKDENTSALPDHSELYETTPTTSTALTTTEGCVSSVISLTELSGSIDWRSCFPNSCKTAEYWNILLPDNYTVTLKIIDIHVSGGYQIDFHSLAPLETLHDVSPANVERSYDKSLHFNTLGFFPFLTYSNNMVIAARPSEGYGCASFDISYTAHPLEDMPAGKVSETFDTDSAQKFTCAANVPQVFLCDLVEQCQGGEDEIDCSYKEDGSCGSWIPYGDHCIKPFFSKMFYHWTGRAVRSHPNLAEEECRKKHGAKLARLTDKKGMELVETMIRASGFFNAVIGIKKVKPNSSKLRHLYQYLWQWGDKGSLIAHQQLEIQRDGPLLDCATMSVYPDVQLTALPCVLPKSVPDGYICMRENPTRSQPARKRLERLDFPHENTSLAVFPTKTCADGSLVQTFHSCAWEDFDMEISEDTKPYLSGSKDSSLPSFQCQFGLSVHYTLVCDGNDDCPDRSDELNCQKPRLPPLLETTFTCSSLQVIPSSLRCDGKPDCFDGSDEEECVTCKPGHILCSSLGCVHLDDVPFFPDNCPPLPPKYTLPTNDLPAVLTLTGRGMALLDPHRECSEFEFRCSNGLCIPAYLINNGEQDCLLGEDEGVARENVTCPGFYRCQGTGQCLHTGYLCDGVHHCPDKDDERYCDLACPQDCSCEGHAYTCSSTFNITQHLRVRYLDLSKTPEPGLKNINYLEMLRFLNLSSCRLKNVSLGGMPMLNILDLSFNLLRGTDSLSLENLSDLRYLNLSANPLVHASDMSFTAFLIKAELGMLKELIIRQTNLHSIDDRAFFPLEQLKLLDLRENKIGVFDKDVFWGLDQLQTLYTDNHKLCCAYFLPPQSQCNAPQDELSSCSDLLRLDFFRAFLWALSLSALLGNAGSLLYRLCVSSQRTAGQRTAQVLVANLCAADLLMGLYMLVIGAADTHYRGRYVSFELQWRNSLVCTAAGFLGFVSSEVSAFIICLVTLDRFLMLCFPLQSSLHMNTRSAAVACAAAWIVGLGLASVPLIARWSFYGQSGICLPLPITRQNYQGQVYAFAVFIVLNFVLFLVIGAGQAIIFHTVRSAGSQFGTGRRQQEMTIARRLFLIVFTDFLCWFPIGLMGLLASQGTPVPGEVNVWAAIFILPLNSALNPFLYTLNGLAERWDRQREARRMKKMMGTLHTQIPKWSPAAVEDVIRICIRSKAVKRERLLQLLGASGDVIVNGGKRDILSSESEQSSVYTSDFESTTRVSDMELL